MRNTIAEIDAAIGEVTKAREYVKRQKSKQVTSPDEIDRLKSVAYAWFHTHRPEVLAFSTTIDLGAVNSGYQKVLDSTGKHASRTTYTEALKAILKCLVQLRGSIAVGTVPQTIRNSSSKTNEAPPDFSPMASDPLMQSILKRRWEEVQDCMGARAYLAATVMMGGLLESLLLARINASTQKSAVFKARKAPHDRAGQTLKLAEWKLANMVDVAHEVQWITKSAMDVGHVLRDFRNYIHPHKELSDAITLSDEDARMFWEVAKSITRQILKSVGKTP